MRTEQNPKLAQAVERIVKLTARSKEIGFEINEVADAAYEAGLVRVPNAPAARKVLKRLAKDSIASDVEREEQRLIEETIDECRAALGLLADLPLGQAAQHSVTSPLHKAVNGAAGGINGTGGAVKRGPGRPPGAKNKPKVPQPQPELVETGAPPIPDWPEAA
jgi:hypothetical protein